MSDDWRAEWGEAKERILRVVSRDPMDTADLFAQVDAMRPRLDRTNVRGAYWSLVNDGELERTDGGVRRSETKRRRSSFDTAATTCPRTCVRGSPSRRSL